MSSRGMARVCSRVARGTFASSHDFGAYVMCHNRFLEAIRK